MAARRAGRASPRRGDVALPQAAQAILTARGMWPDLWTWVAWLNWQRRCQWAPPARHYIQLFKNKPLTFCNRSSPPLGLAAPFGAVVHELERRGRCENNGASFVLTMPVHIQ